MKFNASDFRNKLKGVMENLIAPVKEAYIDGFKTAIDNAYSKQSTGGRYPFKDSKGQVVSEATPEEIRELFIKVEDGVGHNTGIPTQRQELLTREAKRHEVFGNKPLASLAVEATTRPFLDRLAKAAIDKVQ